MKTCRHLALLAIVAAALLSATGCRYMSNRYYDMRDMGALAVGVSTENPCSGIIPPALGVYVEATDFLHLGAIRHAGPVAELDLRGTGVYFEDRTRLGFLFWQALNIDQHYKGACYKNYFKTPNTKWEQWMGSAAMSKKCSGVPAKDLTYEHWVRDLQCGTFLRHRGYQYWEYAGIEAAVCDPFLTHWGVYLRAGFDISEASDFLLGWLGIDYKRDDLDPAMFDEMLHGKIVCHKPCPAPVAAAPAPAVDQAELDRLRAENDRLAKELAACKGELNEIKNGIEIVLPERVMFDTGKATLKPSGKELLSQVAARIRSQYPNHEIEIEGHTDDRPIKHSGWKSNWELGAARSLTVTHYLIQQAGLAEGQFKASTYADNKPVAGNDTAEGRQQNRRSVVVLRAYKPTRVVEGSPATR